MVLASPHPTPDLLWMPVAGRPLLAWSVAACEHTPQIAESLLLVPPERLAEAQSLARSERWEHVRVLPAGPRVRESVETGLSALDPSIVWMVIHEAARPLVSPEHIAAALDLARQTDTDVTTGEPIKETVKRLRDGLVVATLPREHMVRAQTPQIFRRERLLAAHASLHPELDFPDEVELALAAGLPLRIIPGTHDNIRVVSAADVAVAQTMLADRLHQLTQG